MVLISRVALLLLATALTVRLAAADTLVWFGSHRAGPGIGFSVAHFDSATGALSKPAFVTTAVAPAFFVIHPDGRHLYTCNSGRPGGVSAYEIDRATGGLTLLNQQPAGGADTSYISLDRTGRFALIANYEGGNIAVFVLAPDGRLGERTAFVQHAGSSVNPQRQMHAFAHSIITDPSNRFAVVADLGLDKVFVYRFDAQTGALAPNDPAFVTVAPGSGPRHVVFHPNGKLVYLVNEIASTVIAFAWDGARGALAELQTISTLPVDFKDTNACAEMLVRADGKFLYASNRGHDSLAVFAIDEKTGRLAFVEHVSSQGKTPRNFEIDPTGRWLIATNHGSDNAVVFRLDEKSGRLTPTGAPVAVTYPFGIRFLARP
jgi:6-phosphogluconolactonase